MFVFGIKVLVFDALVIASAGGERKIPAVTFLQWSAATTTAEDLTFCSDERNTTQVSLHLT